MTSKLRLKGRLLLVGSSTMMILFLSVGILLILCVGWAVPVYEMFFRDSLSSIAGEYLPVADVALSLLFIFICFAVTVQIRMGADRYFLRLSQKKGGSGRDIFYYLHPKRSFSAMCFSLKISAIRIAFFTVSFLPAAICILLVYSLSAEGISLLVALSLSAGSVLFLINGYVFFRRINALLFLAEYIFISGEFFSFRHILSLSASGIKGRERELLRLKRSFIGWFILCIFIVPIGYVWSYYRQTMAVAAAKFLDG